MFMYKTFQTGTSKMVIYDACLQDTIIMLMDATLSEEDFLALCVYVCGVPVVCPGVPQNDRWVTCSPVMSCPHCHIPQTDCCTDKQCWASGIVWHGLSVVHCVLYNISCISIVTTE